MIKLSTVYFKMYIIPLVEKLLFFPRNFPYVIVYFEQCNSCTVGQTPFIINPKFLSYAAARVRTGPGINLVLLPSDWDHPVKFYRRKSEIFRAKISHFTK